MLLKSYQRYCFVCGKSIIFKGIEKVNYFCSDKCYRIHSKDIRNRCHYLWLNRKLNEVNKNGKCDK